MSSAAFRTRNLSMLGLAALGCLLSVPVLVFLGVLLYCAAVAADGRRALAERLPTPALLGDFEVRLLVRSLCDARLQAQQAILSASPSLDRELSGLPALLDELVRSARPIVEEADRLGCFLFFRARRPELERESVQLAAEVLRAPPRARAEYTSARETVQRQLRICDELMAERERLLAALTHVVSQLRAVPIAIARLELDDARLRGRCDTRSLQAPLAAALAELHEAADQRARIHDETMALAGST